MEMIMISPSQLKVTLDAAEMKKYELDLEGLRGADLRQLALRRILRTASEQTGFEYDGGRVVVRMFPSKDGGCELFVSRLARVSRPQSELCRGDAAVRDGMSVYSFPSLTQLLCACRRLSDAGYADASYAYRENGRDAYYLVIEGESPLICEMGGTRLGSGASGYINEYCTLICGDAVARLSRFA